MTVRLNTFTINHYEQAYALWSTTKGIGLSDADSKENIQEFLIRNPLLSVVAERDGQLVGASLAGHDGRRGYIHHLAVADQHRRMGIGKKIVEACLDNLKNAGIAKCHLFIFHENLSGKEFWESIGWSYRSDLGIISKTLEPWS